MEYLIELMVFAGKAFSVLIVFGLCIGAMMAISLKKKSAAKLGSVTCVLLNKLYERRKFQFLMSTGKVKAAKELKARSKEQQPESPKSTLFVIDFDGDVEASQVSSLREEVTSILLGASENDEVLVKITSGGGIVSSYGLAAAQLVRIRQAGLKLTVSVDEVAASGGYMMACVADKIIASPFAIIGSIGVVATMPNFNKLITKHDIDYEQFTSGEFKRTITMFGKNTDEGRLKLKDGLKEVHEQFKQHVHRFRPSVDLEKSANGDDWSGENSIERNLVDELLTSDEYVMQKINHSYLVCKVKYSKPESTSRKLSLALASAFKSQLTEVLLKSTRPH